MSLSSTQNETCFRKKVVEKIQTHSVFSSFFSEDVAVYEIMWKNVVEPGRPQMTIWHLFISRWIPKDTNTHSEYVIIIAVLQQQWLHKHAPMLRYTYIDLLVTK
jgi:hypothetical protein